MKTDLSKILAVNGQHGLYEYVAQARNGAIAQRLEDKKRTVIDIKSRITTLADISIYTSEGEIKLSEVFLSIKKSLGKEGKIDSKLPESELKAIFEKAVPNYDSERFYYSHMKKIADWYNDLVNFASLDFVKEEEEEAK